MDLVSIVVYTIASAEVSILVRAEVSILVCAMVSELVSTVYIDEKRKNLHYSAQCRTEHKISEG